MMVTWDNYEEYLMLYIDGELSLAKKQELQAFIEAHQEIKEELHYYQSVKLTADMDEVFISKEQLLKAEPVKARPFKRWLPYGMAAALLLIAASAMLKWNVTNRRVKEITIVKQQQSAPIKKDTVQPIQSNNITIAAVTTPKHKAAVSQHHRLYKAIVLKEDQNINTEIIALTGMPVKKSEPLKNKSSAIDELNTIAVPEVALAKKNNDLLDRLPIDEERKDFYRKVGNTVSNKLQQAKAIKNDLLIADVILKVGNRDIKINL